MDLKTVLREICWAVAAFLFSFAIFGSSQMRGALDFGHEQKDIDPVITLGFALFMTICFMFFKAQYLRSIKKNKEVPP